MELMLAPLTCGSRAQRIQIDGAVEVEQGAIDLGLQHPVGQRVLVRNLMGLGLASELGAPCDELAQAVAPFVALPDLSRVHGQRHGQVHQAFAGSQRDQRMNEQAQRLMKAA